MAVKNVAKHTHVCHNLDTIVVILQRMLTIMAAMLFRETDVRLGRHLLGAFSEYSSLARAVSVSIRSTRRTVLTINCCCFPCVMHLRRHWRRHFEHRLIIDSGICLIVWSVGMSSVRHVLKAV